MRFIDEAKIKVIAGHGGPGCVSFRRETFVPRGGPDGGDGGAGGNIVIQASRQLGTLQDFRFRRTYQAGAGLHGSGANKSGKAGEHVTILVPVGTIVKDPETQEVIVDFLEDQQTWVACKGGRGGKGNAHFTTATHQAPKFAQPGEEGEQRELFFELKLLADVGIIGFPNAGKSTLISAISGAKPKIADYPFTTLTPHLGVVYLPGYESFVIADIPGLVEGAHRGIGLGHKFLKHMERTRLFVHLLDGAQLLEDATSGESEEALNRLVERYQQIRTELKLFSEDLLSKPEMIVLNKVDLVSFSDDPGTSALFENARVALRQKIGAIRGKEASAEEPWVISAVSQQGISELLTAIYSSIQDQKDADAEEELLPDDFRVRF